MSVRLVKWLGILLVFTLLCGCGDALPEVNESALNSSAVSIQAAVSSRTPQELSDEYLDKVSRSPWQKDIERVMTLLDMQPSDLFAEDKAPGFGRETYPTAEDFQKIKEGMTASQVFANIGIPLDRGGRYITGAGYMDNSGNAYEILFGGVKGKDWLEVLSVRSLGKYDVDPDKEWWPETPPEQAVNKEYIDAIDEDRWLRYADDMLKYNGVDMGEIRSGCTDYPHSDLFKRLYVGMSTSDMFLTVGFPIYRDGSGNILERYQTSDGYIYQVKLNPFLGHFVSGQAVFRLYLGGEWDTVTGNRIWYQEKEQIF